MLDIIVNENWITFAHNEIDLDAVSSVSIDNSGTITLLGCVRRMPVLDSRLLEKLDKDTRCSFVKVKGWSVLSNKEVPFKFIK